MPTSIKPRPGQLAAIERIQEQRNFQSRHWTLLNVLDDGLEANSLYSFNRACSKLGVTGQREAFSAWRQENDVPLYATLVEWMGYIREFETEGDARDLRDTQRDALT